MDKACSYCNKIISFSNDTLWMLDGLYYCKKCFEIMQKKAVNNDEKLKEKEKPIHANNRCRNCKHAEEGEWDWWCNRKSLCKESIRPDDERKCFEPKEDIKPVNEMIDKISSVCADIEKTLISKNTDYGNSFQETLCKYGDVAFMVRLEDKWARLNSLYGKKEVLVKDESFEDTIRDMAGYCLLYLAIKKQEGK